MTMEALQAAAEGFVGIYHADTRLCAGQANWDCVIRLAPDEAVPRVVMTVRKGRVSVAPDDGGECDLEVRASLQVLLDILELRLNPSEPYVFGELTVIGAEADFMRVDYVAGVLCAA